MYMYMHDILMLYILSDIIVRFSKTTYSIDENNGPVQLTLILTNPSSIDITVQVKDNEVSATSK